MPTLIQLETQLRLTFYCSYVVLIAHLVVMYLSIHLYIRPSIDCTIIIIASVYVC